MKRWIEDVVFSAIIMAAMAGSGVVACVVAARIIEAIRSL